MPDFEKPYIDPLDGNSPVFGEEARRFIQFSVSRLNRFLKTGYPNLQNRSGYLPTVGTTYSFPEQDFFTLNTLAGSDPSRFVQLGPVIVEVAAAKAYFYTNQQNYDTKLDGSGDDLLRTVRFSVDLLFAAASLIPNFAPLDRLPGSLSSAILAKLDQLPPKEGIPAPMYRKVQQLGPNSREQMPRGRVFGKGAKISWGVDIDHKYHPVIDIGTQMDWAIRAAVAFSLGIQFIRFINQNQPEARIGMKPLPEKLTAIRKFLNFLGYQDNIPYDSPVKDLEERRFCTDYFEGRLLQKMLEEMKKPYTNIPFKRYLNPRWVTGSV